MKLACVLTAVFACITIAAFTVLPPRLCFKGGKNYTFYCGSSSADCREVLTSSPDVKRLFIKDVCGESAEYENFDLESFLKSVNGKVVFREELSDSVNYYCTADLPYSVKLYCHDINLHVCIKDGSAKAASPIIFGGY